MDNYYTEPKNKVEEEKRDNYRSAIMSKPFNPADIDITNKLMTIDLLVTRLRQAPQEIEMDTSSYFQRKAGLWDEATQSRLIESVLIRFPLPAFYFDGNNEQKWLVVDGLQRLTSLENFIVKKTLKLQGLEFLPQLHGRDFDSIGRDLQRVIMESQVLAYIINKGTPDDVKFNIFKRINTGGLILNAQEIRHALHQKVAAELLAEMAALHSFKRATGGIVSDRMEDREFINRFLSFYLLQHSSIESDIDVTMNRALLEVSKLSSSDIENCKKSFDAAMNLSFDIFGKYAFRKTKERETRRNPLNKALFEVISVIFSKLTTRDAAKLKDKKELFLAEYYKLMTSRKFLDAITTFTSEPRRITLRYIAVDNIVKKVLGVKE
jgi:hypothetical protein